MGAARILLYCFIGLVLSLFQERALGQELVYVHGTVYDKSLYFALPSVSVMGTSGQGTMTDSMGNYAIHLHPTDSIYFSYLGKQTAKFPLKTINLMYPLNMSLQVTVDSLPTVVVRPRDPVSDSLENRMEYQKIFNYERNGYLTGPSSGSMGVGVDLDALLNPKKERQILRLQARLIEQEHDKFVDRRFNKSLVRKITGLQGPALDTFMKVYRPSYEFLLSFDNDYDYYVSIRDWGREFYHYWRRDHPDYRLHS